MPASEFVLCAAVAPVEASEATLLEDEVSEVDVADVEDEAIEVSELVVVDQVSLEVTDVVALVAGPVVAG